MHQPSKTSLRLLLLGLGFVLTIFIFLVHSSISTSVSAAQHSASAVRVISRETDSTSYAAERACPLVQYGQIFSKQLAAGEQDCYGFNAEAGDRVTIALDMKLCCEHFSVTLRTPQNGRWVCDFAPSYCEINDIELPLDGYYVVTVDGKDNDAGAYVLAVNHLNDKAESIVDGTTQSQEIWPAGDQDSYTFFGGAGHRISALLDKGLCCALFLLKLTKPDGTFWLCAFTPADCPINNVTLPETGIYTLTVDGQNESADEYKLELTCEHCPPIPTATPTPTVVPTPQATPTPRFPDPNDVYLPTIASNR